MRHGSALLGSTMLVLALTLLGCGSDSTTATDDTPTTADAPTTGVGSTSPTPTPSPTPSDPPSVSQADVEAQITEKLTDAGEPPDSVHCDGDLAGVVGTRLACTILLTETPAGVTVEVTSLDAGSVNFTISIDEAG